ncbi:twin-arginine translocase subunit TatC [Clostridium sp. SHJSY1]|uniref:twin-arginine translocase subunit TatC n=1 Tax=Clostridium sp. SHJSY1 TaxID=2942483 RepID=UPI00287531DA|nr:twin-arginine translocase subunit TatC [Clostridium sp. SHJSY1]MDS0527538.1 twin-arginine translocase subunit TatC [Clostridium sp. SHJSY1]
MKSEQIVQFVNWLEKFRKAIIAIFFIVIISTLIMYSQVDIIIKFLVEPLGSTQLYFLTPTEGFITKMKVAFLSGIIITFPIIAYLILLIVISKISKKNIIIVGLVLIPFSMVLFAGGIIFGYKLLVPSTIKFLLECGNDFMKATISGSNYMSFIETLILLVGFLFELPLILIGLSRIKIITSKMLKGKRKFAIMSSLIIVACIAPSLDAMTFILVTLPIIILYEISIWCIFLLEKNDKRKENIREI